MSNRKPFLSASVKKGLRGWIFVSPFVLGLLTVYGKILFDSVLYAFYDLRVTDRPQLTFRGFSNFREALLVNPDFNRTVVESLQKMAFELPVILFFSLFVATLLNGDLPGRGFFRSVFFIPVILTTGVILKAETDNVLLRSVLTDMRPDTGFSQGAGAAFMDALDMRNLLLGLDLPVGFADYIIGLVNSVYDIVTKSGVQILIFLAGLQSVPPSVYESADIEGAGAWEKLWKITFPMLGPIIAANLLYTVIDSFTRPDNALMLLIRKTGLENSDYGLASAMAWIYTGVILVLLGFATPAVLRILRRRNE